MKLRHGLTISLLAILIPGVVSAETKHLIHSSSHHAKKYAQQGKSQKTKKLAHNSSAHHSSAHHLLAHSSFTAHSQLTKSVKHIALHQKAKKQTLAMARPHLHAHKSTLQQESPKVQVVAGAYQAKSEPKKVVLAMNEVPPHVQLPLTSIDSPKPVVQATTAPLHEASVTAPEVNPVASDQSVSQAVPVKAKRKGIVRYFTQLINQSSHTEQAKPSVSSNQPSASSVSPALALTEPTSSAINPPAKVTQTTAENKPKGLLNIIAGLFAKTPKPEQPKVIPQPAAMTPPVSKQAELTTPATPMTQPSTPKPTTAAMKPRGLINVIASWFAKSPAQEPPKAMPALATMSPSVSKQAELIAPSAPIAQPSAPKPTTAASKPRGLISIIANLFAGSPAQEQSKATPAPAPLPITASKQSITPVSAKATQQTTPVTQLIVHAQTLAEATPKGLIPTLTSLLKQVPGMLSENEKQAEKPMITVQATPNPADVVAPGTRLVAGNPHYDDFYILGKSDPMPSKEALTYHPTIASKQDALSVKLSVAEAVKEAKHRSKFPARASAHSLVRANKKSDVQKKLATRHVEKSVPLPLHELGDSSSKESKSAEFQMAERQLLQADTENYSNYDFENQKNSDWGTS